MKISEFIMAKALQHDDFRLTKIAQELNGTENDVEYITKTSGIMSGLIAGGKALMTNPVAKNAILTGAVGGLQGFSSAQEGQKMSGALKGAAFGGILGGAGTLGSRIAKSNLPTGQAFRQEMTSLRQVGTDAATAYRNLNPISPTNVATPKPVAAPKLPLPNMAQPTKRAPGLTTSTVSAPPTYSQSLLTPIKKQRL